MKSWTRLWLWAAIGVLWSCGGDDADGSGDGGGQTADAATTDGGEVIIGDDGVARPAPTSRPKGRFELEAKPAETPLGVIPWPSDVYRRTDGSLDLSGFPRPRANRLLELLISNVEANTPGFGTSATMYLAFAGPIDETWLPASAADSLAPGSTILVVNVDPNSPHYGERHPIIWRYYPDGTPYLPQHTLAVRLVEGESLRPATRYALIATTAIAQPAPQLQEVHGEQRPTDSATALAWTVHAPLRAYLAESGLEVATASVFTTQDPVSELFRARDYLHEKAAPVPEEVRSVSLGPTSVSPRYELFVGTYRALRFQYGEIPYNNAGEGMIRFDLSGEPVPSGEETLRFALTVPTGGDMPPDGWPVVLYAHGTGGNYRSFESNRVASALAQNGMAVLSMDQVHHGTRDNGFCESHTDKDSCTALLFFNIRVPTAARDNVRQAALDVVSLGRLVQNLSADAEISRVDRGFRLNPNNLSFMGHSQGGLNGALFLAIESKVKGGMLSGAGANIAITVEQKTEPFDIPALVRSALGLSSGDALDRWHPTLSLFQTFIEPGDGMNYARHWFHEPWPGHEPKSVFMTVGLEDPYTTPDSTHALAAAGRVPLIEPVHVSLEALDTWGIAPAGLPPYRGNVANGKASAGLAQYPGEGHWVAFRVPSATQRYRRFLGDLATGSPPNIY